ncbi:hypothetical protein K3N28_07925 [Glycomyces sp. TRM65418]|uniref:hypothetical protein n=1 Tax=Glycomyces sp. TRM65418 TaxID=2867006 RepID=UPI001CE5AAFE|nr:hypothetical protein [Glycomyces sp. TRM65418]MCC3762998.1 hypothetical protein [Glycomyces sp. TRM65418]QZD57014.1 hypothetical protein K3N28_07875 [Glycomyces sp. TRM65418]
MHRKLLVTVAVAVAGLTACGGGEADDTPGSGADPATATSESTAEATTVTTAEGDQATDTDPRLQVLVGTWEADPEEVGPHGSTLTVEEDGTATLLSFANQQGAYEGEIVLGDQEAHRFEGVVAEADDEITVELTYDAEADTLTLDYPGDGGAYVHTRA